MANTTDSGQYVLLPPQGLRLRGRGVSPEASELFRVADDTGPQTLSVDDRQVPVRVVDSLGPDGAKLLELSPDSALAIRALRPDLRLVPVVYYTPAVVEPQQVETPVAGGRRSAASDTITLHVVAKNGQPVPNAFVVAFVDFKAKSGAQGVTGADGSVDLALGAASITL